LCIYIYVYRCFTLISGFFLSPYLLSFCNSLIFHAYIVDVQKNNSISISIVFSTQLIIN
jgi:hypothetical protein